MNRPTVTTLLLSTNGSNFAMRVYMVPEPSTSLVLRSYLALLGARRRR